MLGKFKKMENLVNVFIGASKSEGPNGADQTVICLKTSS